MCVCVLHVGGKIGQQKNGDFMGIYYWIWHHLYGFYIEVFENGGTTSSCILNGEDDDSQVNFGMTHVPFYSCIQRLRGSEGATQSFPNHMKV